MSFRRNPGVWKPQGLRQLGYGFQPAVVGEIVEKLSQEEERRGPLRIVALEEESSAARGTGGCTPTSAQTQGR